MAVGTRYHCRISLPVSRRPVRLEYAVLKADAHEFRVFDRQLIVLYLCRVRADD